MQITKLDVSVADQGLSIIISELLYYIHCCLWRIVEASAPATQHARWGTPKMLYINIILFKVGVAVHRSSLET